MEVSYKNYDQKTVHNSISSKLPGEKRKKRTGDPIWEFKIGDVDIDANSFPIHTKQNPSPLRNRKELLNSLGLRLRNTMILSIVP